ncbi:MAG: hypothetical protein KatS3mg114_0614 [Planctomycetaceae bacterium]|nr:MAG: hypothetical protein KatS3mg114_0614 [Planctomycetaceae bacterium]
MKRSIMRCILWCWCILMRISAVEAQDWVHYEEAPIRYSLTAGQNRVSRLQQQVAAGTVTLSYAPDGGYLRALLEALEITPSSQVLVFSKTSLQSDKISPSRPRAIYFNADTHVGWVQDGMIEIAVADAELGMVFYTLNNRSDSPPTFWRETNRCLTCHGSFRTRYVPGLMVRSVYPDPEGHPVVAAGSSLTSYTTPFAERWGGWYVTGRHGAQQHRGNSVLAEHKKPSQWDVSAGQNVVDLQDRFDTSRYLTPHSDLVALMVLEHQVATYNALTLGRFAVWAARWQWEHASESQREAAQAAYQQALNRAIEDIARHLMLVGEYRLTAPVEGSSHFSQEWPATVCGPFPQEWFALDLQTRLFRDPLSYLVHSEMFRGLPLELREGIVQRLEQWVRGEWNPPGGHTLDAAARERIQRRLESVYQSQPLSAR